MPKSLFYFLLIVLNVNFTFAQKVSLKKPLTAEDIIYLKKEASNCFRLLNNIKISYSSNDLKGYQNMLCCL